MPRLPVSAEADPAAFARKQRHARRLRVRRTILSLLVVGLSGWLVVSALSPATGPIVRTLQLLLAVLLPLHLVFFQLDGMRLFDRIRHWPRPISVPILVAALAATPIVLYPLGLVALAVSLFAGGSGGPALAVTGLVMLSPLIVMGVILLMFIAGRYKGG